MASKLLNSNGREIYGIIDNTHPYGYEIYHVNALIYNMSSGSITPPKDISWFVALCNDECLQLQVLWIIYRGHFVNCLLSEAKKLQNINTWSTYFVTTYYTLFVIP